MPTDGLTSASSVARTKVTRGEACSMFNNQTDELITSHVTHPHLIISESLQSKGQWVLISSLYNKKYLLIIHLISIYYWIWQQFQDPRSICLNDALKEFSIFSLKRFFQLFVVNSIRKIIRLCFLELITNYLSELKTDHVSKAWLAEIDIQSLIHSNSILC